jgi:PAS domain S-box-containing protein
MDKLFDKLLSEPGFVNELSFYEKSLSEEMIFVVTDPQGKIIYVNDAFCRASEYTRDELKGKSHSILRSGVHSREFYSALWNTISFGKVWVGEICNLSKYGRRYWTQTTIFPYQDPQTKHIVAYFSIRKNVTDQKKSAEKLDWNLKVQSITSEILKIALHPVGLKAQLNDCLKLICSISWLPIKNQGGIFLRDGQEEILDLVVSIGLGEKVDFNCKRIDFNYCLCGKAAKLGRIVHSSELDHEHTYIYDGMADHGHYNIPIIANKTVIGLIVLYLNAGHKWNEDEAQALELIASAVANLIVGKRVKEEKREAELKAKVRSEFLANMSHEIRTPLNSILGMTQILIESKLTKEQSTQLSHVAHSGEFLLNIINDILDLSKIEAGHLSLDIHSFNMNELIKNIHFMFQQQARAKNIDLEFHYDQTSLYYWGDSHRISQVMINLLGNAIKFTQKGMVSLTFRIIKEQKQEHLVEFVVVDTGIGIAQDKLREIFSSFTQADASMSRKFGGTGLGLSISKKLVDLMDGEILVESVYGKSTTFRVCLPLKVSKPGISNITKKKLSEQAIGDLINNKSILIVEDAEENSYILKQFLKKFSCQLQVCTNGLLGVESYEQGAPDIVVMDIQMPVMDGYTAIKKIREIEVARGVPRVPILALTAHAMEQEREKVIATGADSYLSKPVKKEDFLQEIAFLLQCRYE